LISTEFKPTTFQAGGKMDITAYGATTPAGSNDRLTLQFCDEGRGATIVLDLEARKDGSTGQGLFISADPEFQSVPHGVRVSVGSDLIDQITSEAASHYDPAFGEPDLRAPVGSQRGPLEEVPITYDDRLNLLLSISRLGPRQNVWIGRVRDMRREEDTGFILETAAQVEGTSPSSITPVTVATIVWAISCNGRTKRELYHDCYAAGIPRCVGGRGELTGVEVLIDARSSSETCRCKATCTY
jgi:hypothetical protein